MKTYFCENTKCSNLERVISMCEIEYNNDGKPICFDCGHILIEGEDSK